MFCPYCRSDIPDRSLVCPECGERLKQARQDRGFDRDRFVRRMIMLGILLILLLLAALGVTYMLVGSAPAAPPAVTPVPTILATPPPATAAPAVAFTAAPTAVPTLPPTAAPTAAPVLAPQPPDLSIDSVDDAVKLMEWMIQTNTFTANLDRLSITGDQLREASEYHPSIQSWQYRTGDVAATLIIELRTGAKILAAMANNAMHTLSAEEQSIAAQAQSAVAQLITPGMSDFKKELAIHDYIIYNCDYEINESLNTEDALGFYRHGRLQCCGYSDMFTLLGTLCGLEIRSVEGDVAGETGGHELNLIRLDGVWYAVDVTWDDPVGGGAETYTFLNVPHRFFDGERIYNRATLPAGAYANVIDSNNYYARMGLLASGYAEAEALLTRQLASGNSATICYTGGKLDLEPLVNAVLQSIGRSGAWSWRENTKLPGTSIYKITIK